MSRVGWSRVVDSLLGLNLEIGLTLDLRLTLWQVEAQVGWKTKSGLQKPVALPAAANHGRAGGLMMVTDVDPHCCAGACHFG